MTIRPVCSCRHPKALHRGGTSGCTAPSCRGGPDHGPCPAYQPADARAPEPVTVAAAVAGPMLTDIRGVARFLRLSRCTVLALADQGELTRLKFGKSLRFEVDEVQDLVRRRRVEAQAPRRSALSPAGDHP